MAVTMYAFLEAILLLVNAVAVLNEERFLARIGWGRDQVNQSHGFGQEEKGMKQQIVNLIHAIRTVMRGNFALEYRDHHLDKLVNMAKVFNYLGGAWIEEETLFGVFGFASQVNQNFKRNLSLNL